MTSPFADELAIVLTAADEAVTAERVLKAVDEIPLIYPSVWAAESVRLSDENKVASSGFCYTEAGVYSLCRAILPGLFRLVKPLFLSDPAMARAMVNAAIAQRESILPSLRLAVGTQTGNIVGVHPAARLPLQRSEFCQLAIPFLVRKSVVLEVAHLSESSIVFRARSAAPVAALRTPHEADGKVVYEPFCAAWRFSYTETGLRPFQVFRGYYRNWRRSWLLAPVRTGAGASERTAAETKKRLASALAASGKFKEFGERAEFLRQQLLIPQSRVFSDLAPYASELARGLYRRFRIAPSVFIKAFSQCLSEGAYNKSNSAIARNRLDLVLKLSEMASELGSESAALRLEHAAMCLFQRWK